MAELQLTLDSPTADLTNFPLTIFLSSASGKSDFDATAIFTELGSSWNKLIITDSTDTSLPIEVELWDDTASKAVLHVKVPTVSSSSNTILTIDYTSTNGVNPDIDVIGSTVGKSVWDSNFLAVYHMCQDPSVGGACVLDSTGNVRHLTPNGSMTSGDLVDAMVGKGLDFDSDDYLYNADVRLTASMSYDLCLNANSVSGDQGAWIQGNFSVGGQQGSLVRLNGSTLQLMNYSGGTWRYYAATQTLSAGTNTAISASFDSSAALTARYCVNGTENTVSMATALATSSSYGLRVATGWANAIDRKYQGKISELRISNIARSAAWVVYSNKSLRDDASTFSSPAVVGSISITESGVDVFSSIGSIIISGNMTVSEIGSDTVDFIGSHEIISGSFNVIENYGADTVSSNGNILISGQLSITENADLYTFTGEVSNKKIEIWMNDSIFNTEFFVKSKLTRNFYIDSVLTEEFETTSKLINR